MPRRSASVRATFFVTVLAVATAVTGKDGEARAQTAARSITCLAGTGLRNENRHRSFGRREARGNAAPEK